MPPKYRGEGNRGGTRRGRGRGRDQRERQESFGEGGSRRYEQVYRQERRRDFGSATQSRSASLPTGVSHPHRESVLNQRHAASFSHATTFGQSPYDQSHDLSGEQFPNQVPQPFGLTPLWDYPPHPLGHPASILQPNYWTTIPLPPSLPPPAWTHPFTPISFQYTEPQQIQDAEYTPFEPLAFPQHRSVGMHGEPHLQKEPRAPVSPVGPRVTREHQATGKPSMSSLPSAASTSKTSMPVVFKRARSPSPVIKGRRLSTLTASPRGRDEKANNLRSKAAELNASAPQPQRAKDSLNATISPFGEDSPSTIPVATPLTSEKPHSPSVPIFSRNTL
ncbi:hypothetical protein BT69DRAFT_114545 [Atractiella rhizophila]|nr:hypothetical protein BT69DRAFT_114545 [Atractiella rhizophila]